MANSTEAPPTSFTLSNGARMPAVGYGTFQSAAGNDHVEDFVSTALRVGYRHIDTALAYGNEKEVGRMIKKSAIPREELFVTTKLAQPWHRPEDVEEAMDESLKALGLEYVPHAYLPGPNHETVRHSSGNGKPVVDYAASKGYPATWAAMEKLVSIGKARAIGLSNFNILKTKKILEVARIKPAVNQVELHPYMPQHALLAFSARNGIHLTAHQPLGGTPVGVVALNNHIPGPLHDQTVKNIAKRLDKSPAQILLSWALQRGTSVVPKSARESRMKENLEVVRLSDEDFEALNGLKSDGNSIRYMDPRKHVGFDIFREDADEPVDDHAPWDEQWYRDLSQANGPGREQLFRGQKVPLCTPLNDTYINGI
ncbi:MAG: hypothetical protein M1831_003692 [Alyxoria varia]|nr:MAG: hypothetical protein M1831_003692 [Alyxoria varia]